MKAVLCVKYGKPELLEIREIDKPYVDKNDILIKIHATTIASGDCVVRNATNILIKLFFGLRKPRNPILGTDLSGVIESVGENVTNFKVGDRVFASTGMKFGGHAEYTSISSNSAIVHIPDGVSYEEATAIAFGGSAALHFLRKIDTTTKKTILIYGASGAVGTSMVQLAKHFNLEVTGVCSTKNIDLVKSLGANNVLDYTNDSFLTNKNKYDIVFDAVGKGSKKQLKSFLNKEGKYFTISKGMVKELSSDLILLSNLLKDKKISAVIDKVYPLDQIVDAYNYVETGRKVGNVVIKIV